MKSVKATIGDGHLNDAYLTFPAPSTSSPIICTGQLPSSFAPSASLKVSTGDSDARHKRLVLLSDSKRSEEPERSDEDLDQDLTSAACIYFCDTYMESVDTQ
jgi:hypothetical protein